MRLPRLRSLVVLVALVGALLPGVAPIAAASTGADLNAAAVQERCTRGDAEALFQVSPLPAQVMRPRGQDHPGLLEAYSNCQYRVFRDGATVTFCEDDFIVGGIVAYWDYKVDGISRAEAIGILETAVDRVWLDGVEQTLRVTAYKDLNSVNLGVIVYQVRAFVTQLQPGDYVSTWVATYPDGPDDTATVYLHILPRELCA